MIINGTSRSELRRKYRHMRNMLNKHCLKETMNLCEQLEEPIRFDLMFCNVLLLIVVNENNIRLFILAYKLMLEMFADPVFVSLFCFRCYLSLIAVGKGINSVSERIEEWRHSFMVLRRQYYYFVKTD